jgi:cytidylate kinase
LLLRSIFAASGSSTANEVARRLGFLHVDSGALYRALTLVALDLGEDATAEQILKAAELRDVRLRVEGQRLWALMEGADAEPRIRSPEVTAFVSPVSAMPAVREWVNARLRHLAAGGLSLVLEAATSARDLSDRPSRFFLMPRPRYGPGEGWSSRAGRSIRKRWRAKPG